MTAASVLFAAQPNTQGPACSLADEGLLLLLAILQLLPGTPVALVNNMANARPTRPDLLPPYARLLVRAAALRSHTWVLPHACTLQTAAQ
jgi:hypothetical protein